MKYVNIFSFQAIDKLKEGKTLFVLDKKVCEVYEVCYMSVLQMMEIIKDDGKSGRYEFWYVEEEENAEL